MRLLLVLFRLAAFEEEEDDECLDPLEDEDEDDEVEDEDEDTDDEDKCFSSDLTLLMFINN
jgi:hypothetical protein